MKIKHIISHNDQAGNLKKYLVFKAHTFTENISFKFTTVKHEELYLSIGFIRNSARLLKIS